MLARYSPDIPRCSGTDGVVFFLSGLIIWRHVREAAVGNVIESLCPLEEDATIAPS